MLLIRPLDVRCTVEVCMDFAPREEGDEAGVTMYLSSQGYICLSIRRTGGRDVLTVTRSMGGPRPMDVPAPAGPCIFRIVAGKETYQLSVTGADGVDRPVVTIPVLSRAQAGKCFTGTLLGVYAQSEAETEARALVTRFSMRRM